MPRNKYKTSILLKVTYMYIISFKIYFYLIIYTSVSIQSTFLLSTLYKVILVRAIDVMMNESSSLHEIYTLVGGSDNK